DLGAVARRALRCRAALPYGGGMTFPPTSRRTVLQASATAGVAALAARTAPAGWFHGVDDTIRVGLVGCGGRGTGAAVNALLADPHAKLVAMHDAFGDQIERSLASLAQARGRAVAAQVDVPPERRFVGFDGYDKLLACGVDVVLLASPPHFRPMQVEKATAVGVHMFVEKPVAVDAPGVRRVLAACRTAKAKGLSVVSGLCYRYHEGRRAVIERVRAGDIGRILTIDVNYMTGDLWHRGRQPHWTEMEFQLRNWLYFTWLSGDHIAEQHTP